MSTECWNPHLSLPAVLDGVQGSFFYVQARGGHPVLPLIRVLPSRDSSGGVSESTIDTFHDLGGSKLISQGFRDSQFMEIECFFQSFAYARGRSGGARVKPLHPCDPFLLGVGIGRCGIGGFHLTPNLLGNVGIGDLGGNVFPFVPRAPLNPCLISKDFFGIYTKIPYAQVPKLC